MLRTLTLSAMIALAACEQPGSSDLKLSNAWARPTAGQAPAAVYVTITNAGPAEDRLTGAFTDRAAMAMIHQTELVDGVARMRMAGEIRVPGEGKIEMVPGGTHIMLQGLRKPLNDGDDFELVLKFRQAGDKKVTVKVAKAEGL